MRDFELGGGWGDCGRSIGDIAPAGSYADRLLPGQQMRAGQWLRSPDGRWGLAMQGDGNLVLYRQDDGRAYWDLGSQGRGALFAMQTDGNLVMYDAAMHALWATDTAGRLGAYLVLQNDANLVLYERTTPYWYSDTVGAQRHDQSGWLEDIASTFVQVVQTVAPIAQTALSFVPGVGTVASAAIAAGVALAEGSSITDALISGVGNALPGGPLTAAAFKAGVQVVQGQNVGTAAIGAARDLVTQQGGPVATAAFDVAVSLAVGQGVQQGYIAPILADTAAAAPSSAVHATMANRLGIVKGKIETGAVSFAQLAQHAQLVDIAPTPAGLARARAAAQAKTVKTVAIAAASVGAVGAAGYYSWPWLSTLQAVKTVASVFSTRRRSR